MDNNELYHWGILGQKWGIRRYQNKDGTLTPAGRRRQAKLEEKRAKLDNEYKKLHRVKPASQTPQQQPQPPQQSQRPKSIKDLTDAELKAKYDRLKLEIDYNKLFKDEAADRYNRLKSENDYRELYNQMRPKKKSFIRGLIDSNKDKVVKELSDVAIRKAKDYLESKLGLKTVDPYTALKKEFDMLDLKKKINELKNPKEDPYTALKKEFDLLDMNKKINELKNPKVDQWEALKTEVEGLRLNSQKDDYLNPDKKGKSKGISEDRAKELIYEILGNQ